MSSRSSTRPRSSRAWSRGRRATPRRRSEEHTSELQSQSNLVCRLLLEKKKTATSLSLGSDTHLLRPLSLHIFGSATLYSIHANSSLNLTRAHSVPRILLRASSAHIYLH